MRAGNPGFLSSVFAVLFSLVFLTPRAASATPLDDAVAQALASHGFSGRVEATVEARLGRPIDRKLADVGRFLWFDTIAGLADDNSCGGCHSPGAGFGDTQSIAIGVDNNGVVGPGRTGPRNQRRTPSAINTVLYPRLMWNGRFAALSGDSFDNSQGFSFPLPEGMSLSGKSHLLVAQAFIPPTERVEAAGFDFVGDNDAIRAEVVNRLNAAPGYVQKMAAIFPEVAAGGPITYDMFAQATAEFESTLVFANAPVDRFARGHREAMNDSQKRGALLFFGKAGCVSCHSVSGGSNEMFSDFENHVIGVPQIVPSVTNMVYDGPGQNEDFGLEQVTGDPEDRYMFRSAPLRNLAVASTFMHNGAFTTLESAIVHHLDVPASVAAFTTAHLAPDLQNPIGPMEDVLDRLDPLLQAPIALTAAELADLVEFVGNGLTDERAKQDNLDRLIPASVPSGNATLTFEIACSSDAQCSSLSFCDDSVCSPKLALGAACSASSECATGSCQSGLCKKDQAVTCKEILRGGAAGFNKVEDALISGDHPTWAAGPYEGLWVGKSSAGNENRSIVRWDLSGIPANAKVRSAVAQLNVSWNTSAMEIAAHPALAAWNETTIKASTYVKPGAWDTSPFLHFFAGGPGYKSLDVTALVSDWVSGVLPNRGVVLTEPKFDSHLIFSSESTKATSRPRLTVCYSTP